jgi:hypothetical protein
MSFLQNLILFGLKEIEDQNRINEEFKEKILKEFKESVNLPRKKKKQKRKELNLMWSIANWDPFV